MIKRSGRLYTRLQYETISGKESSANTEWEDLRTLDVGSWKIPLGGGGFRFLKTLGPNDLLWMVEIKCGDEIVEPLLEAIDEIGLRSGSGL